MRPLLAAGIVVFLAAGVSHAPGQGASDLPRPAFVFDDFADPGTGWTVRSDGRTEMGYRDGTYRIAMAARSPVQLASAGQSVADGRVAIRLRDLSPSAPHPAGLFVRAQDAGNFHGFAVLSDGSFLAFHYVDGVFVQDSPEGALVPSGLYRRDGAENDIAIEAGASRLVFLLNYVELFRIENALWTGGEAGLLAANPTDGPAGTAFDTWRIDRFTCPFSPRPVCAPG
jgi:hypothetical protein